MTPFEGPPWAAYAPAGARYSVDRNHAARTRRLLGAGRRRLRGEADPSRRASADRAGQGIQHPLRHQHHAGGRRRGQRAAGRRGDHAGRQHVILPASHARPSDLPNESYLERRTTTASSRPRDMGARASTPTIVARRTAAIEDGDVVMVPKGYHPVATVHGYDSTISMSWPARSGFGSSTTSRRRVAVHPKIRLRLETPKPTTSEDDPPPLGEPPKLAVKPAR